MTALETPNVGPCDLSQDETTEKFSSSVLDVQSGKTGEDGKFECDPVLVKVSNALQKGWYPKTPDLDPYFSVRRELVVKKGRLFKKESLIPPSNERRNILLAAHYGHPGATRMVDLL